MRVPYTPPRLMKPRHRGLLHLYAFFVSLPALSFLLLASPTRRAAFAASVYGLSVTALFGVSALFHRVTWSLRARRWMGRLDHAMINVLIAGTFTPIGLLVLSGRVANVSLAVVWSGAVAGIVIHALWIDDTPKWLSALLYLVLGWSAMAAMPDLASRVGGGGTAVIP